MESEKLVGGLEIPGRIKDVCSGNTRVKKVVVREEDT